MGSGKSRYSEMLAEAGAVLERIEPGALEQLAEAICTAQSVHVAGAGRTGFAMKMLAMRLAQAGLTVHAAGEPTAIACGRGDLVLIGSGSGKTATLQALAKQALRAESRLALLTRSPDSPLAEAAETIVYLPAPLDPSRPGGLASSQPLGTLFEQVLVFACDRLVELVLERLGTDAAALQQRHANLE